MNILQKTGCRRDRKFRKATFENQAISGNSKKRGALNFIGTELPKKRINNWMILMT